jgi:hypothetical protein
MKQAVLQTVYRTRFSVVFMACLTFVGMMQWVAAKLTDDELSPQTWGEAALQFPLEVVWSTPPAL